MLSETFRIVLQGVKFISVYKKLWNTITDDHRYSQDCFSSCHRTMSSQQGNQPTSKTSILQINYTTFQAAVTATVAAVMAQFNANNPNETGISFDNWNRCNIQWNRKGPSHNDTPAHKPKNNKRMFWNKKERKLSKRLAKRQQPMTTHTATTSVTSVPKPVQHYAGNLPDCKKCNFHHLGKCRNLRCKNCKRQGHTTCFCKAPTWSITQVLGVGMS